jgi:hypothetical protein
MNNINLKKECKKLVELYLSTEDDYADAKLELIKDLNLAFKSKGDKHGVVDGELKSEIKTLLDNYK